MDNKTTVVCKGCGVKISLPCNRGDLLVTCPRCKYEFRYYTGDKPLQSNMTKKKEKKNDQNRFIIVFLFVIIVCGFGFLFLNSNIQNRESKAKTEEEVLQDIIGTGRFKKYIANSNTADYTIEIYNRITTPEAKSDLMEFNVQLVTDFAEIYYYNGHIEYSLYNEGWSIHGNPYGGQISYKPLKEFDDNEIYDFLDAYEQDDGIIGWDWDKLGSWSTYKIIGKDDSGSQVTYEIEFDGERTRKINCYFDPTDGTWEISTYWWP